MSLPLILVTNDDGINSRALWAVVEAVSPLGEVLVVAPGRQWSGGGRSKPQGVTGQITAVQGPIRDVTVTAYAVDGSPAQAVAHAVLEIAPRPISLAVSGANLGPNLGLEVTVSGTVGAALEAAAHGIPSLAVSMDMDASAYLSEGDLLGNYDAAKVYTHRFAQRLLSAGRTHDVDVLNINVPRDATADTPWRLTSLSRCRYYEPLPPDRSTGRLRPRYQVVSNVARLEWDSDIRAMLVDRVVSVTPLSLDLTSRVDRSQMTGLLNSPLSVWQEIQGFAPLLMARSLQARLA